MALRKINSDPETSRVPRAGVEWGLPEGPPGVACPARAGRRWKRTPGQTTGECDPASGDAAVGICKAGGLRKNIQHRVDSYGIGAGIRQASGKSILGWEVPPASLIRLPVRKPGRTPAPPARSGPEDTHAPSRGGCATRSASASFCRPPPRRGIVVPRRRLAPQCGFIARRPRDPPAPAGCLPAGGTRRPARPDTSPGRRSAPPPPRSPTWHSSGTAWRWYRGYSPAP